MNKPIASPVVEMEEQDWLAAGSRVLEDEVIYLDEQRWQEWLALFTEDCEYWVPSWKDDNTLTDDPEVELSHIYYDSRTALEDRVLRFTSHISPASNPRPRTTHLLSNIRLRDGTTADRLCLRASWVTHVFYPHENHINTLFGRAEHDLVQEKGRWLIAKKKVILQNDYLPPVLDLYCL